MCNLIIKISSVTIFLFMTSSLTINGKDIERNEFEKINSLAWNLVFEDSGTLMEKNKDAWQEKWFLDGEIGHVENTPDGLQMTSGPRHFDNAHHMVLWTKQEFYNDVKLEFEFTRLDFEKRCVNIIYLLATGSGEGAYEKDITKWSSLRKVPTMNKYYNNMNLYHISFAAYSATERDEPQYIRARRYNPAAGPGISGTELKPDYFPEGLFEPGVTHNITVIKDENALYMKIQNPEQVQYCKMVNTDTDELTEGRIGFRQMYTRSSVIKNIKVFSKK